MQNKDKLLKQKKEECSNDFNKIITKEKTNKKNQDIQKETKSIISEINDLLKFCSLPLINMKMEDFGGLEIDKVKNNVLEGTSTLIKENEIIVVDFSKLKQHINEENDKMNQAITIYLAFLMDIYGYYWINGYLFRLC